jgi:hypothetical protein
MRIISKFRDFYDGVMKTGMDREVVYVRETVEVPLKESFGIDFSTKYEGSYYKIETFYFGYCGEIRRVMVVSTWYPDCEKTRDVFFQYEEFKEFMLNNNIGSKYDFGERRWWPSKYQKFMDLDTSKMKELFHTHQTPLFFLNHVHSYRSPDKTILTMGPSLQGINFQKIKDAYTTYQDIFQFVAGTLNKPESKMVKISDKDKIAKHGFDKWSFRQKGPKKK